MKKIGLIGAGVWGTALALTASRASCEVLAYAREKEVIDSINNNHVNSVFMPDFNLPETIKATSQIAELFDFANYILVTVSAQHTRSTLTLIKPFVKDDTVLILCAKGIEEKTGAILSEIMADILPNTQFAVLSGPGFAYEVAKQKPTAVTIASKDISLAGKLSEFLASGYFRPYATDDIISPQIGGSVKNVLAIASGVIEGAGLGDNARAALITRGINEMIKLSKALGGRPTTMMGMSSLGDLVLTASCHQSRNFSFGYEIGKSNSAKDLIENNQKTVEGIFTANAVLIRAKSLGIELPICQMIFEVLYHNYPIEKAVLDLLSRPLKEEGF